MSNPIRFFLLLLFPLSVFCQTENYDPAHLYSVDELQKDFQFVRTTLEKKHPNLYLYTSKKDLDNFFDSLNNSIVNPLTELDFYNIITLLNSKIMNGHTMFLPGEKALNYFSKKGKFFPFIVVIEKGKVYVNMNCSADTTIKEGAEILSINNISTSNILDQLLIRQIHDGYNKTYPVWILTNYFKDYFGFSFGHPNTFAISFKTVNGEEQTTVIDALPKDSIEFNKQKKYAIGLSADSNKNKGIILEINKRSRIAILTIKSFDDNILVSTYKQHFKTTIEKMFVQINDDHIRDLVLDIRNNQGGDFEPSRILLSYLISKPIKFLFSSNEQRKLMPQKNNYKGKLYTLINGGTFSSSAILCSYLELTKRGIFIGEEAAGNKNSISGDPIDLILPNTKILAEISTVKYLIRKGFNNGHGVMPTYSVISTIKNILSDKDAVKEFTLDLISKKITH